MINDFNEKTSLITGGTKGIGLSIALAFASQGAKCVLTYKWDDENIEKVRQSFHTLGYKEPLIVQANVAEEKDNLKLLELIKNQQNRPEEKIDIFVSNVAFGLLTKSFDDYSERGLLKSIEYSAWPMVSLTKLIKQNLGDYPKYVLGLSSNGPDAYHPNYDFVACSKALLETMVRYLNYRLKDDDIIFNIIRARFLKTESLRATFGEDFEKFGEKYNITDFFIETSEVANAALALCSGMMDGVRGEVINIDNGSTFSDNIMSYYENREKLGM